MDKLFSKGLLFFPLMLTTALSFAQIQFNEVTDTAGPFDSTESWGASWGDLNSDGYPDLFVSNHRVRPALFRNNGDGTFTDVILSVDTSNTWLLNVLDDTHAGSWADYDNDGDQDLNNLTGACCDAKMQVNTNSRFQEMSTELGLAVDAEGRTAGWFDYNNDGLLDSIIHARAPNRLYQQQTDGTFLERTSQDGMTCTYTNFGVPSDVDGDGKMEWICVDDGQFPQSVLEITPDFKFKDIIYPFPSTLFSTDAAIADFNGDLRPDIFVTRGRIRPVGSTYISSTNKVEAWLESALDGQVSGLTFISDGVITLYLYSNNYSGYKVSIGAGGLLPSPISMTVTLDPVDTTTHGFIPSDPNFDPFAVDSKNIYIGYDPVLKLWQLLLSPGTKSTRAYISIQATAPVTDLTTTGQKPLDFPLVPSLLMNTGSGFVNESSTRGFTSPVTCPSIATGDFDNDMDVDIYAVCKGYVENIANRLYQNQGDGTFIEVVNAGGAQGLIGVGLDSGAATGEGVAVADYDIDGFLDLFVTNGMLMQPFKVGGPDQMFRNTSGDPGMLTENNHWILLDLVGAGPPSGSNRDGIGAKVFATAGGITQLREQNGGFRRWGQNHQRIHFGLAVNTVVDIRVEWPSGQVDTFTSVAVDQLYQVNEGSSIAPVVLGGVNDFPAPQPGDECGTPLYNAADDGAAFLWKDCAGDGSWHLRVTGGSAPTAIRYDGDIVSGLGFTTITGFSFDGGEVLDTFDPTQAIFSLNVTGSGVDGLDFSFPTGSATCFTLDQPTKQVFLGATHLPVATPISFELGACLNGGTGSGSALSINDLTVAEDGGIANFSVDLSTASSQTVMIDYATADGSATVIDGDYVAASGTLIFAAGEISKTISVTILDDTVAEASENFFINLSNPVNASVIDGRAVGTIADNEISACGAPVFDKASEQGVFLWNDCSGGTGWHMTVTGGGSTSALAYDGVITSDQNFTSVIGSSIESNDVLDTSNPLVLDYLLYVLNTGQDTVDFSYPAGSNVCFDMTSAGLPVYVGSARQVIAPPFDLETLSGCTSLTVSDVTVSETDGTANFAVDLSSASTQTVTVDFATADGTATVLDGDYLATNGTLTFAPGEISKNVAVTIVDDAATEGSEVFTLGLSNAVNALIVDSQGQGTILDNEVNACGTPVFDKATEQGVFLWNDCSGGTGWHMTVTGGGSTSALAYDGVITSDQNFTSVIGSSIESNDVLDTSNPVVLDYLLYVLNTGQDTVDFSYPAGSNVCFDMTSAGLPVYVGSARQVIAPPFDLETLSGCTSLTVSDVTVSETDGTANFAVDLSSASTQTVTVDFATADGTATVLDGDYLATNGTLTFAPGEISKNVAVTIVDDAATEGSEVFTLGLSNAVNALIVDSQGQGTILDNEVNACGTPVFDKATEQGVFLWNDCSGGTGWHMTVTGGGSTSALAYDGVITSDQNFTSVIGSSIESNDVLDTSNPLVLDYLLYVLNTGKDTVDFSYPAGSNVCFDMTSAGLPVYVGSARQVIAPPFDLETLSGCTSLTVSDVTVSETDGTANFAVDLSSASTQTVTVVFATADGSAIAGASGDYLATSGILTFAPGEISKTVSVSILDDSIAESTETFTLGLSNATNALIIDSLGQGAILDDEISACGAPVFDVSTEPGIFLWNDCSGGTGWHMVASGGGSATVLNYSGAITADQNFTSVTGIGIEASDNLDTSNPLVIKYKLLALYSGTDQVDFTYPGGTNVCFDMTSAGLPVYVGASRLMLTPTFDLNTLGSCL